jgi:3',5'-cyclic AMP phosphodiesterase CpdA
VVPETHEPTGDGSDTPTRIAHVSDLHVGAEDGAGAVEALIADVRAARVAATVVTGDLTMRARSREFARAKEAVDALPNPVMVVIGNHDVPLLNPLRRLSQPYQKFHDWVAADLDPLLDLPGVRLRGLGSMPRWRWKSGRVSDRQAELVVRTFADTPAGVVRVVALHHPPSSDHLERMAGSGGFEQALVEAGVDVVLAGHTHVPRVNVLALGSATSARTVVEVVAGTATSRRTRGVSRSWSLLELSPRRITVTEHVAVQDEWRAQTPRSWPLAAGGPRSRGG